MSNFNKTIGQNEMDVSQENLNVSFSPLHSAMSTASEDTRPEFSIFFFKKIWNLIIHCYI